MNKLFYPKGLLIILAFSFLLQSCNIRENNDIGKNTETKVEKTQISKEEEFKSLFPNLELISLNNNIMIVKGAYDYTGNIDYDCHEMDKDVWEIANKYKNVNSLKLNIFLKGTDKYGNTKLNDLGLCNPIDLNEVRKYRGTEFYGKDVLSGGREVFECMLKSKSSPYKLPY